MPLRGLADANPKQLRKEDIYRIFSNIEMIINVNTELLSALQYRLQVWSPNAIIGDIFLSMVLSPQEDYYLTWPIFRPRSLSSTANIAVTMQTHRARSRDVAKSLSLRPS